MTFYQSQARELLKQNYLIIPIQHGDKRPAMRAWQNARLSAIDVPRVWSNGAGIGVLCGVGAWPVMAVDIDIRDAVMADKVETLCVGLLGATCVRVGQAPKRLLVYRAAAPGWSKITSKVWLTGEGEDAVAHRVEVLGAGQQFVALGIHPATGREFEWVDLVGGIEALGADVLPVVEHGALVDVVAGFERLARSAGWTVKSEAPAGIGGGGGPAGASNGGTPCEGEKQPKSTIHHSSVDGLDALDKAANEARLGRSAEDIADAIGVLSAEDYDQWLRLGLAIHHETAGSDEGLDIWTEWSRERGADKFAGWDDCARRWEGFGRDRGAGAQRVTLRTVATLLERQGAIEQRNLIIHGRAPAPVVRVAPGRPALGAVLPEGYDLVGDAPAGVLGGAGAALDASLLADVGLAPGAGRLRRAKTEMGNAERLLDAFGAGLMYVPELRRWYSWTGVYWRRAFDVELESLAKSTILALREELELWEEGDERGAFLKFCSASQKRQMVSNMVALAASDPRVVVPASELDKDWWALGVRNGVVDLRDGSLHAPDGSRRVTMVSGCEYAPGARCELWERTVNDVFMGDEDMVSFFQRLCGYTLMGKGDEDVLVIPHGQGSNGKSTLLRVLSAVFGDYARSAAAETFLSAGGVGGAGGAVGPRPDLLSLRGARLVWVGEPDQGAELREAFVKSVTSGDPIPARAMHSNDVLEIRPSWVTWMATNHLPTVRGDEWAVWRRLMPVPFLRNFDHDLVVAKDVDRDQKLIGDSEALSGILSWCVKGALAYQRERALRRPVAVDAAREAYREDMDLLAAWLDECCELSPEGVASCSALWQSWSSFAHSRGELRFVSSMKALSRRLEARGFGKLKHSVAHGVRGFSGVKIKAGGGL